VKKVNLTITVNNAKINVEVEQHTNINSMLKSVGTKRVKEIVNLSLRHDAINRAKDEYMKSMAKEQVIHNLARATGIPLTKARKIVASMFTDKSTDKGDKK